MDSEPRVSAQEPVNSAREAECRSALYFDSRTSEWVVSRFADVQAAFLEPGLCPVGASRERQVTAKDREDQARVRAEAITAITLDKLSRWESCFMAEAERIVSSLPNCRAIDVVGEFARPWALTVAVQVTGANIEDAQHLEHLAAQVSASTANPDEPSLKAPSEAAGAELDRMLGRSDVPMAGPAFVGLSQTLPCLLANVWHALLERPHELKRLHNDADILPRALEELLRMAGLVNVLHRQAIEDVDLNGTTIGAGQRIRLMLGSAHRDPEQFRAPDELDIKRQMIRHFAFGAGPHSCAAASLLRMSLAIATRSFVSNFEAHETPLSVNWRGGTGFCWPEPLYANRRQN